MEWKKLTKEQKQQRILIVLAAITVLYVGNTFVLRPMKKKWKEAAKTIEELDSKVRNAERLLNTDATVQRQIIENYKEANRLAEKHLPPGDKYGWAASIVYSIRSKIGVDLTVTDAGQLDTLTRGRNAMRLKEGSPAFVPYTVKVGMRCGYYDLLRLIAELESKSPYATVSNLTIEQQPSTPEDHIVDLRIQWPVWANPKIKDIVENASQG
jgi:hypothetical protein